MPPQELHERLSGKVRRALIREHIIIDQQVFFVTWVSTIGNLSAQTNAGNVAAVATDGVSNSKPRNFLNDSLEGFSM